MAIILTGSYVISHGHQLDKCTLKDTSSAYDKIGAVVVYDFDKPSFAKYHK